MSSSDHKYDDLWDYPLEFLIMNTCFLITYIAAVLILRYCAKVRFDRF